jgi:hypothetical protein
MELLASVNEPANGGSESEKVQRDGEPDHASGGDGEEEL